MHIGFLSPEHVTPDRPEGGLANYLRKISRPLAGSGHKVTLLALGDRNEDRTEHGVEIRVVQRPRAPLWPRLCPSGAVRSAAPALAIRRAARRLAQAVWTVHREQPFDVLQTSSYQAPGWALRHNGAVPVVCRVSSYTPLSRVANGRTRSLADHLTDYLEARQVLDAEGAFAPSELMASVYRRFEGADVAVVRTPVVLPRSDGDDRYYRERIAGGPYLLYFGTLSRLKGVDLIAEMAPRLLAQEPDVRLVFVGRDDGLPDGRPAFDAVRSRCGDLAARVSHHPPLPGDPLRPIIAHAVGVLMPSRIDNYPNACLEALAEGTPVIGTTESSIDEIITDGETGFLAKNGSADDLLKATVRLLRLPAEQRRRLRARVRDCASRLAALDPVADLVALYERVIAEHRSCGTHG
jgi:glycosyltransferase involved in cell wall biosynthesis